ncbi:hypothetical protein Poli38472_010039 [Pythium oligandrum]|uniref:Uncharacterized protein n=1 Tax=Pythium oligandrum TaxID=41045 RepID=A0A8K1C8M1_PYTOL|nr:hypothetical protein Poli38472_010039 [Pythium oligandrum]|eukprot:TMW58480.1 hypothetical protein Poli38472_010039 [Pythium oligandrum]
MESETEDTMFVVFGSANAFGHDVDETELLLLIGTVFVISVLIVLVFKLARGWEDAHKTTPLLPVHGRVTNRWVSTRKQHYGRLGTITEDEVFTMDLKQM